jgi:hypothetical protein
MIGLFLTICMQFLMISKNFLKIFIIIYIRCRTLSVKKY